MARTIIQWRKARCAIELKIMTRDEIEDLYSDDEPDMLFTDGYDEAIAGTVWDGERTRVVYKVEEILNILMERDEMTYDEASEYFDFNIAGSNMGVYTPLYLETWESMKRHKVKMSYKKRNPFAQEVRTEKYKPKTIPDKRDKLKEKDAWTELIENLRRR